MNYTKSTIYWLEVANFEFNYDTTKLSEAENMENLKIKFYFIEIYV